MQVKKFEARTMKEALEMVKSQLGPDAIILSARDNNRSFGLVGEGSVEITAAVSEDTLQKKKFVESRLREEDKQKLNNSSARMQKQIISNMVNKYTKDKADREPRQVTSTRYIEIADDGDHAHMASDRIRGAAQRAWSAMQGDGTLIPTEGYITQAPAPAPQKFSTPVQTSPEIQTLKGEIAALKQVISQFNQIPQSMAAGRHPGADYGLCFEVSPMFEKLVAAGIAEEIAAEILTQAQDQMPALKLKNKALVEAWTAKTILTTTNIVTDKKTARVQMFVGPAGSGKTASLIKLASHYVVRENKKVALVTTDTMKVGAADQMRIYAQILNVPFAIVRNKTDWQKIFAQLSTYDYVLVDFAGLSLRSMDEISLIRSLMPPDDWEARVHLVLSCLAKDSDLTEIGKRYKVTGFQDVIFTGIDESSQHGSIYNFMKRFAIPLHSFGLGSRVPEDYEMATKERILDLLFKITKMHANTPA
jgi:flagellar biosynthesis protein FlhF